MLARAPLTLLLLLCGASQAFAFNVNCGIEPIPPIGCNGAGTCVCDKSGQHCSWQFGCSDSENKFESGPPSKFSGPPPVNFDNGPDWTKLGRSIREKFIGKPEAKPEAKGRCPDRPGFPNKGCPDTEMPAGVVKTDKAWIACLYSSMAVQKDQFRDRNQAVEATFLACATEEQALRSALIDESHLTNQEAETFLGGHFKPVMKEKLIEASR